MVPSHNLDWRPERAGDLCCFIQETLLTQTFEAVAVCLSLCAALMIPCPVGLVKIRLPSCQLGGVTSWRISQPVASKMTRDGSEMLTQGGALWFPGTAGVKLQTAQLVSYSVSVSLRALLLGYTGTCWPLVMLALWHPHHADKHTAAEVTGHVWGSVKCLC